MNDYTVLIDGGDGGMRIISADNIDSAMRSAMLWAAAGSWDAASKDAVVVVYVYRDLDDGEREEATRLLEVWHRLTADTNGGTWESGGSWYVDDEEGGRWWPDEQTAEEIWSSDDPASLAVAICRVEPQRGAWTS